jgi:hypothetical protein
MRTSKYRSFKDMVIPTVIMAIPAAVLANVIAKGFRS